MQTEREKAAKNFFIDVLPDLLVYSLWVTIFHPFEECRHGYVTFKIIYSIFSLFFSFSSLPQIPTDPCLQDVAGLSSSREVILRRAGYEIAENFGTDYLHGEVS